MSPLVLSLIVVFSLLFLVLLILFLYSGYKYADLFFSYRHNPKEGKRKFLTSPDKKQVLTYDEEFFKKHDFQEVTVKSKDGLDLKGHLLIENSSHRYILSVHGYRGNYKELSHQCRYLNEELGYSLLMIEQRAQGSEGKYITFGYKEREDVLVWAEYLVSNDPQAQIVLYGFSMGAATVLMASSLPLPKNVKGIVADSSYVSTRNELTYVGKRKYGKEYFWISASSRFAAFFLAHFSYTRYTPLKSVKKDTLPLLLIHGNKDTYVPFSDFETLKKNVPSSTYLSTFVGKGAWHGMSFLVDPEGYRNALRSFLKDCVK